VAETKPTPDLVHRAQIHGGRVILGCGMVINGDRMVIYRDRMVIDGWGMVIIGNRMAILGCGMVINGDRMVIYRDKMVILGSRMVIHGEKMAMTDLNNLQSPGHKMDMIVLDYSTIHGETIPHGKRILGVMKIHIGVKITKIVGVLIVRGDLRELITTILRDPFHLLVRDPASLKGDPTRAQVQALAGDQVHMVWFRNDHIKLKTLLGAKMETSGVRFRRKGI